VLARTPSNLLRGVRQRPQPVRKLARHRRIAIRDALAAMMRRAQPTAFALEAPSRHALRVVLIYRGWRWGAADAEAMLLVQAALAMAGVKRPTWEQGQPEFTQHGVKPPPRENCVRCGRPLPEYHKRYCSDVCARASQETHYLQMAAEEKHAKYLAYRTACKEKAAEKECVGCGRAFRPFRDSVKYCSPECLNDVRRFEFRRLRMVCEEVPADAD
jgi:hypothetical protein